MSPGSSDLIFLILVFLGLQSWWIIPLIKKNNSLNKRSNKLVGEIQQLEKLYRN